MEEKLPVEVSIENEKLLKLELDLQETFQVIESKTQSLDEFDIAVKSAQSSLKTLRKANERFSSVVLEWDSHKLFEDKMRPLVGSHQTILHSKQNNFQRACLGGRKRIQQLETKELLSSTTSNNSSSPKVSQQSEVRHRKLQKAEAATQSKDATNDLKRIALMMSAQVKHSEESTEQLEMSSQQIVKVHEEYKGLTGIVALSKKLLNKYNRRELTDTLLIFFGLLLFSATVLFIISKRL